MPLSSLRIEALRNIRQVELNLGHGINILAGANGSGKTSILEAVHLLSQGKSFRSGNPRQLISRGADAATVAAHLQGAAGTRRIGIGLGATNRQLRIDGQPCEKQASLAWLLPVVALQPSAQILVESAPELRRQFMDWGAFHLLGRPFLVAWRRYAKCLEQRNALLRKGAKSELAVWEGELAHHGEILANARADYSARLAPFFTETAMRLLGDTLPVLSYDRGWPAESGLEQSLADTRDRDQRLGFTGAGPHRADFRLIVEGVAARQLLSRGELKLVVVALKLAQALLAQSQASLENGDVCLLVDDLPSELDAANRDNFLSYLYDAGLQSLVTGTELDRFGKILARSDVTVFHVEHGAVRPA